MGADELWSNLANVAGVWNTENPFDQSRKKHVGCFEEVMDGEFCRSYIRQNNLEVGVDLLAPIILHMDETPVTSNGRFGCTPAKDWGHSEQDCCAFSLGPCEQLHLLSDVTRHGSEFRCRLGRTQSEVCRQKSFKENQQDAQRHLLRPTW